VSYRYIANLTVVGRSRGAKISAACFYKEKQRSDEGTATEFTRESQSRLIVQAATRSPLNA
jgi:hypothetical protein